ncbi:hypothetical protein [Streptomyces sp. MUM 203J]|nr:hypothetical protein [Streptomyces sp. MUM 203J]
MLSAHLEVSVRYRIDQVKAAPGEDDGKGGNPSGGCGDGDGCGRK